MTWIAEKYSSTTQMPSRFIAPKREVASTSSQPGDQHEGSQSKPFSESEGEQWLWGATMATSMSSNEPEDTHRQFSITGRADTRKQSRCVGSTMQSTTPLKYTQTFADDQESLVACGTSSSGLRSSISIWKGKLVKPSEQQPTPPKTRSIADVAQGISDVIKTMASWLFAFWIIYKMLVRARQAWGSEDYLIGRQETQPGSDIQTYWQGTLRPALLRIL